MLGNEWLDIGPNERKKVHTHPSKWVLFKQVLASTLMIGLIIGVSIQDFATEVQIGRLQLRTILLSGIPLALLLPLAAQIQRLSTHYVITDRNIWAKEKIYARDVDPTVRSRVQGVSYSQSKLDRLLDKGDVKIETAGTGEVDTVFRDVPNPSGITALVREGIEEADEVHQVKNV
jgi:uncharacterized membrane protein YdbT with pleckstrin-like domain